LDGSSTGGSFDDDLTVPEMIEFLLVGDAARYDNVVVELASA